MFNALRKSDIHQVRIRQRDPLWIHGYGRETGDGGVKIEFILFMDIHDLDGDKDHSMQCGETTEEEFRELMRNFNPDLRKNGVRVTAPTRTIEMLHWCYANVRGFWPSWGV